MTQDEIVRMAQEAGFDVEPYLLVDSKMARLERFFNLVAAHERAKCFDAAMKAAEKAVDAAMLLERETCAKSVYDSTDWAHEERDMVLKEAIAAAIRARSNHAK